MTNLLELHSCVPIILIAQFPWTWSFTEPIGKVNGGINWVLSGTTWFFRLIKLIKGFSEIDLRSRGLEQLRITTN